jgi:hypothetical protein
VCVRVCVEREREELMNAPSTHTHTHTHTHTGNSKKIFRLKNETFKDVDLGWYAANGLCKDVLGKDVKETY